MWTYAKMPKSFHFRHLLSRDIVFLSWRQSVHMEELKTMSLWIVDFFPLIWMHLFPTELADFITYFTVISVGLVASIPETAPYDFVEDDDVYYPAANWSNSFDWKLFKVIRHLCWVHVSITRLVYWGLGLIITL